MKTQANKSAFAKQGFGLLEVLIAALVLGFLLVGMNIMQKGNREAVLRIRSRDAAQIIAQDFLDSLSSLGISSIDTGKIKQENGVDSVTRNYEWTGGKDGGITAEIKYIIKGKISKADTSVESSNFTRATSNKDTVHITSKKIDLTVSWPFKGSTQSISVSRIIK